MGSFSRREKRRKFGSFSKDTLDNRAIQRTPTKNSSDESESDQNSTNEPVDHSVPQMPPPEFIPDLNTPNVDLNLGYLSDSPEVPADG